MNHSQNSLHKKFTAIILAGDRKGANPVAEAAGTPCKTLATAGTKPMLLHVLEAIEKSGCVGDIIISGPEADIFSGSELLQSIVKETRATWLPPGPSPCASTMQALERIGGHDRPVLLTTGDHALLSPEIVSWFCSNSLDSGCDITAALARTSEVIEHFPGTHRTSYRLKDGDFCSCNLFGVINANGRKAVSFWKKIEEQRKNPVKIIAAFGLTALIRYAIGIITLQEGMERISSRIGCRACALLTPYPEAALDVDTPDDLAMISRIIMNRSEQARR